MDTTVYDNAFSIPSVNWLIIALLAVCGGCVGQSSPDDPIDGKLVERFGSPEDYDDPPFAEIDPDLLRLALAEHDYSSTDGITFLTTTPPCKWSESGGMVSLPKEFHESLAKVGHNFLPASQADVKDESVLQKGTNKASSLVWITVKRRLSNTQVIVESGLWCGPLYGGGSLDLFVQVHGIWEHKKTLSSWVA